MPEEYCARGHVSPKLDAFSYGVVLLELITGRAPTAVVQLAYEDEALVRNVHRYVDAEAGAWPKRAVKGLAAVAEGCHQYRATNRTTVASVLPKLKALAASASTS